MDQLHGLSMKRARAVAGWAMPQRRLLLLSLLVLVFMAFLLLVLHQDDATRDDGSVTVSRAQLSRRGATDWVDLPHSFLATPSDAVDVPVVYGFSVNLPAEPEVPMGLFVKRVARAGVLYVNGHAVAACAEGPVARIRCQDRPALFRIPSTLLRAGFNRFELVAFPSFIHRTGISPPVLGDLDTLYRRYHGPDTVERVTLRAALLWVFSVSGALTLIVGWSVRMKSFQYLGVTIVMHSLYRWSSLAVAPPLEPYLFEGLVNTFRLMAGPWFYLAVLHHFGEASAWRHWGLILMSLLLPAAWWTLGVSAQTAMLVFVPMLSVMLIMTVACAWWAWRHGTAKNALLTLCLALIVIGGGNDWLVLSGWAGGGVDYHWYFFAATAAVASGVSLKAVFSGLRETLRFGEVMAAKLQQRETELDKTYRNLLQYENDAARMQERERIMRDMHDGLGSSLASAKLAAQSGSVSPSDIAQVLQDCLDDMRLVLDASSVTILPLSEAIADYRYRMEPRLRAAGIESSWVMDLPMDLALDVSTTLSLMRVIQEAITNSVRHAQAQHIGITLQGCSAPTAMLTVFIQDDGIGSTTSKPPCGGRGTRNAQRRAQQIGAHYDRKADHSGTTVSLVLPLCSGREVAVA